MFGTIRPPRPEKEKITWKFVAIVVGLLAVIAAVFTAGALIPQPDLVPVLDAFYDYGNSTVGPMIAIVGLVFNNGTKAASCTLNFTINDSRGWSLSDSLNLGPIQPGGGSAVVNRSYAWPLVFNGISVISPIPIVPEWTFTITQH